MRRPDFLIVGAMKAGTTTLFFDLLQNPAVFMPTDKEPGHLLCDDVCTPGGRRDYEARFKRARADQLCGEASTGYTKLPDYPGVPNRAVRLLGRELKVIYLVREPVARIMSQHHHERSGGRITCGIDEAVRRYPRFIDYSRYAMQITPWLETLGPQQVLILHFESYVENRGATVDDVSRFLGIQPGGDQIDADAVYNRSGGKPVREGPFEVLRTTALYRSLVRPILSPGVRQSLRRFLLPRAPQHAETPSAQTVEHIIDELAEDVERLRVIMGADEPLWNLERALATASSASPGSPREDEG